MAPTVGGMKFPYTDAGRRAAKEAEKGMKKSTKPGVAPGMAGKPKPPATKSGGMKKK